MASIPAHRGRQALLAAVALAALAGWLALDARQPSDELWAAGRPMPEFSNQSPRAWINSGPLTRADLQGKVVLIEVWTSI